MEITVIKENMATTSYWAGGESKQYYIYPPTSSYTARDFCFRLSMAISTSNDEAKYSNLENITRHLVMLEGSSHVFHKEHYDIIMNPYKEIDVFDGGWESSGVGKAADFNMMLAKGAHGKMTVVDKNGNFAIGGYCETCHKQYNRTAFFCGQGNTALTFSNGKTVNIYKGDLILLEDLSSDLDVNMLLFDSKLVRMDICC